MSNFPDLSKFSDYDLLWVMCYEHGKERPSWSHGHFLSAQDELLKRYPRDTILGAFVANNMPQHAYRWLSHEAA